MTERSSSTASAGGVSDLVLADEASAANYTWMLLTMSRTWSAWAALRKLLSGQAAVYPGAVLMHGDCPQGDRGAAAIWRELGGLTMAYPADWARYGRSAGFRRNALMVELARQRRARVCLAAIRDRSAGASGCADLAERAGIMTLRFRQEELPGELPAAPWETPS